MSLAVKIDKKSGNIVIELPLEKPRRSASGKSLLLASSHGCHSGEATFRGYPVVVAASAFIFPDKAKSSKRKRKGRVKRRLVN
jgi:hypothetical protein